MLRECIRCVFLMLRGTVSDHRKRVKRLQQVARALYSHFLANNNFFLHPPPSKITHIWFICVSKFTQGVNISVHLCHQNCREGHWFQPPLHGHHIHPTLSEERTEQPQGQTSPNSCLVSVGEFRLQPKTLQEHPCSQGSPPHQLLPSHCQTCGT